MAGKLHNAVEKFEASKFTAASCGSLCDGTAFLFYIFILYM